jgi:hypothetical protein
VNTLRPSVTSAIPDAFADPFRAGDDPVTVIADLQVVLAPSGAVQLIRRRRLIVQLMTFPEISATL